MSVKLEAGGLPLDGYLCKWAAMTARDPRRALAHLLYLGYEGEPGSLLHVSKSRRPERKAEQPERSVYQVG